MHHEKCSNQQWYNFTPTEKTIKSLASNMRTMIIIKTAIQLRWHSYAGAKKRKQAEIRCKMLQQKKKDQLS